LEILREEMNVSKKPRLREVHPHRELEKRVFHLKTLYEVSQEMGFVRSPQEIIKNLLMMIMGTFGATSGVTLLVDMKRGKLEAITQRGMGRPSIDILSQAIESGCYKELKDLTCTWILDARDKRQTKDRKILELLSSLRIDIWVPLTASENIMGGIGLGEKLTKDPYTSDDQELLSTLSAQGAIAIKNAKLVEKLEKRVFHLKTLYDLSQEIGFIEGTHGIMKNLLMMIMGTFGVVNGLALLVDSKSGKIESVTQRGMAKSAIDRLSRSIETGCCKDLKGINCIQILDKHIKKRGKDILNLLSSMKMSIWVPFQVNENLLSGIGLGEKLLGDSYTKDDQELLCTLCNQGAVAINNAKLIEQMKREEVVRTNLARYLSPQIVDKIIKKDVTVNLGGDRKVVTVLFSDIRNFTRISETQRPDQLVQILNEYFTEMAKIIFENQGSLDKYIGDAIVAVFGSLIPLENSAKNAVQAAVQMMKGMPELNEKWMKEYGFSMDIGIGINTGEVFLGNIGSPERMEFTVIGDTVNVASRFSGLAQPGQILITEETQTSLNNDVPYRELPQTAVKGKTGKLDVFEILFS
jgi:adenylate cyclase